MLRFIFILSLWLKAHISGAQNLDTDELQAYHNYLQKSLYKQHHDGFKSSLEKVKNLILNDLQTKNKEIQTEKLLSAHNQAWLSILIDYNFENQNLLISLLSNQNLPMRSEKFSTLIEYGLFHIDSNADLSWTYNNLNYQYFEEYLIYQANEGDQDLFPFLLSFLTHKQSNSWSPAVSSYQKFKNSWVQRHYLEILDSLLKHKHFDAAAFLIEQLPSYSVRYLQHYEDPDLNISIRCFSPVMESILRAMDKLYMQSGNLANFQLQEQLGEAHIFDVFSKDLLQNQPFSADARSRFEKALSHLNLSLKPELTESYKSYISLGQIRNHFLGIYSRFLHLELAACEQPKRFFYELIAYLHSENPIFEHLFGFQGFEYLFLNRGGNGEDFLNIALNRFDFYMFSILMRNISSEFLGNQFQNFFHSLISVVDTSSALDTIKAEASCLRIVRFILFTHQIDTYQIIKYLRQKNRQGETPLYLAAKKGLYRVFFTLKKYLNDRAYFSDDEHAPPYFLDTILKRGLEQRKHRNLSQELEKVLRKLQTKIENRNEHDNCLSSYSDNKIADARHQALIVSKIEIILAQAIPPKKNPAKYLYPYAFSQVVKHYFAANFWTGTFKDFSQAPASIQMSYLKKPVSLIINKIIFSCAKGSLQTEDIMHMLCGKKHNRISNVLKELLIEHIQTLLNEDKRKIGQW